MSWPHETAVKYHMQRQALASPLSGLIGDKADRTKVVAAGCLLWGVMTSAIGLATTIPQVGICARTKCGV